MSLSEQPLQEASSVADAAPAPAVEPASTITIQTVIDELTSLADHDADEISTEDINRLKLQFYSLHNALVASRREEWVAAGNPPEEFSAQDSDPDEARFKELMSAVREKKAAARELREAVQAANLTAKKEIIEQIITLSADTDNVNRHYQQAKDLQARFKEIGDVPPQATADIWKQYQDAVERFYDQLKINMELRDYDFKKNLAEKQALLDEAVKLADEQDVIAAFRRLQSLHDKWRLTGPVAKELREEIWGKFKDASAVVNKRYQEYFEERKAREQESEAAKTALCEKVEAIDVTTITTYSGWDAATRSVLEAQEEWKKVAPLPRKLNNQLFARFREACDRFFSAKAEFFQRTKDELAENLRKKTALAERAEALSESSDWRKATDELVKLQQEWKGIGPVAKKQSDAIWRRFHDACDRFFDRKKEATGSQRATELANLKAKQELIERLRQITAEMPREEAIARLKEVQAEWPAIGHVPFRDKDKVYDSYRQLCDKLYKELDVKGNGARMAAFADSVDEMASDSQRLGRERDRLSRALDARRNELKTFENNMGFLSSKSKGGDSMVRQMQQRIERLREEIANMTEKLRLIDSKL